MRYSLVAVFFSVAACAAAFGQTEYRGIRPGTTLRADTERVLGQPVKQHSPTLIEYPAQGPSGRIFVQYAAEAGRVERIEFLCRTSNSNCDELTRILKLPISEIGYYTATHAADPGGKIVRYFRAPYYLVVTVDNESEGGFYWLSPARIALYSEELYRSAEAMASAEAAKEVPFLTVRSLRFFEGGMDPPPQWERVYRRKFAGEGTRYVHYELGVAYPKSKLGQPVKITAVWSRDGPMEPVRQINDTKYDYASTSYYFSHGLGNVDGQQFARRKGKWKVEIYMEGQLVATGTFEIY